MHTALLGVCEHQLCEVLDCCYSHSLARPKIIQLSKEEIKIGKNKGTNQMFEQLKRKFTEQGDILALAMPIYQLLKSSYTKEILKIDPHC